MKNIIKNNGYTLFILGFLSAMAFGLIKLAAMLETLQA